SFFTSSSFFTSVSRNFTSSCTDFEASATSGSGSGIGSSLTSSTGGSGSGNSGKTISVTSTFASFTFLLNFSPKSDLYATDPPKANPIQTTPSNNASSVVLGFSSRNLYAP